jgi:head-tail adaptor
MIDPGALRTRIELFRPSLSDDDIGGASIDLVSAGAAWARLEAAATAGGGAYDGAVARSGYSVEIRMRRDVRPGWRLVCAGRTLRVTALADADAAGVMLRLSCEEEFL